MSERGDIADRAAELNEQIDSAAIEHARTVPQHLAGPSRCKMCKGWNDRADAGYAVCTGCLSGDER